MVWRSKATKRIAAAVLVLVSIVAALILAEGIVRLVSPQPVGRALPMYEPDSLLIHRLKPGFHGELKTDEFSVEIVINSLGFRGAEWAKDPNHRIVVIGDSFTFGYGVPERWAFPSLLQDSLRHRDRNVTVYNAGVPGYGITQEQRLLEGLWDLLDPHSVILAFTVGSDLRNEVEQNIRPELGYEVQNGYLIPKGMPMGQPLPMKAFLQERSHLYVLLQKARVRMSLRRDVTRATAESCDHFLAAKPCGETAAAWEIVREALCHIKARCDERGAAFLLLAIPHPAQVSDALWGKELKRLPSEASSYARFGVQAILRDSAEAMSIPFVDPMHEFRQVSAARLYFGLDRHMTEAAHLIVANKLLQVMGGIVKTESEEVVDRS